MVPYTWTKVIASRYIIANLINFTFPAISSDPTFNTYQINVWQIGVTCPQRETQHPFAQCWIQERENKNVVIRNIDSDKNYCVEVTPVHTKDGEGCRAGCISNSEAGEPHFSNQVDCKDWNATIFLHPMTHEKRIHVNFGVYPNYYMCFDEFHLQLWKEVNPNYECDGKTGVKFHSKKISASRNMSEVTFYELPSSNYCVRVIPYVGSCKKFRADLILYSRIVSLYPPSDILPIILPSPTPSYSWFIPVVVLSSFIVLFGILGGVLWILCRGPVRPPSSPLESITETQEETKTVQVFILYSHDSPVHKKVISAFVHFLRVCWNVNVIVDIEQTHIININPEDWLIKMLQYDCDIGGDCSHSNADVEKKIIIVESKRAVYEQEAREEGEALDDLYQYYLEELFINGLTMIRSNLARSLDDYCHLFVIHFSYTPRKYMLKYIVPNQRYYIPDHLAELYMAIHSTSKTNHSVEAHPTPAQLESTWSQSFAYHQFLQSIEEAMENVS